MAAQVQKYHLGNKILLVQSLNLKQETIHKMEMARSDNSILIILHVVKRT